MRRLYATMLCLFLLLSYCASADGNSVSTNVTETGTVSGCITWQYNDYVGTKPDVDAYIALFPYDGGNIIDQDYTDVVMLTFDLSGENRIYGRKADGYGNYVFDNVVSGDYLMLIVSRKTIGGDRFKDEAEWTEEVESLFGFLDSDTMEVLKVFIGYNKYTFSVVEVLPGKTTTVSHDFGNTYI